MNQDIIYNILLQSDDKTIANLCQTNQETYTIGHDKHFWEAKFKLHYVEPLLIQYEPDVLYNYVEWFHYAMNNVAQAKNILKINYMEKNRTYDKTNGIFKVLLEGITDCYLFYIYYYFPTTTHINSFTEIIFTLLNNEYHLEIMYLDNGLKRIDLGKITLKQAEQMLPSLLEITGVCTDQGGYDMIYDDKNYNDYPVVTSRKLSYLLIRRGMWEIINANK